jgi:hypothetical protein
MSPPSGNTSSEENWTTIGAAVAQLVEALRYKSRVRFPMVLVDFFIGISLSVALWPWDLLSL